MENISRRNFMKGVGTVALAAAATGLLGGCSDGSVVVTADGLNNDAEYKGIKLTVREVLYAWDVKGGSFYVVPKVVVQNNSAAGIPVDPANGSFEILVNGSSKLTVNSDTMAELKTLSGITTRTLSRGGTSVGYICGTGSKVATVNYAYITYYPNPADTKTCLRCKIPQNQWKLLGTL